MAFVRELEMRYLGQGYELAIPMTTLARAIEAFHEKHERTYGYASREDAVEVVAARLVAVGEVPKPQIEAVVRLRDAPHPYAHHDKRRQVYFAQKGWIDTPVYQREGLALGATVEGPAIIEQYDSATLVAPSWTARVDELGNLNMVRA
jgi:N-methylhydantoinase A